MQIFLVGGAVRDQQLNYPTSENDWVVVGSSVEAMLAKGYKQVGKDFPVFLHPQTGEEYALARQERKVSQGYHGFTIDSTDKITLEQDLLRRDLTINAMAMDDSGQIIDPYGGQADLEAKLLRHVSPAFAEDPLRILRVARFAARYHHLGFSIADETLELMTQLAKTGELTSISADRVWTETQRAMTERSPQIYFQTLKDCSALTDWFAEIDCLWGIPNPAKWHPEIDTGVHTMMVLEQAAKLSYESATRFAAVCHDLGKGVTPMSEWPSHKGHEKNGIAIIETLCHRLKVPTTFRQLAKIVSEFHLHLHKIEQLKPTTIVKLMEKTDAFRKPERFEQFIRCCEADYRGRTGFEDRDYPQGQILRDLFQLCLKVTSREFISQGIQGAQIGEKIHQSRVTQVKIYLKQLENRLAQLAQ
ncbi:MAG: multifunctional CCA addition/repair protein [Enterobacterales bacterium]|nr:multifunctional CCA addition/repair protein [Enterobacterales bacterium]